MVVDACRHCFPGPSLSPPLLPGFHEMSKFALSHTLLHDVQLLLRLTAE
jgi:hypothetical protein